ncbi:MAG: Gfo/Idh/MocA family oxidoreductase [Alphaproteobacteria bacterium]|nr:Gfo/Idh/MocA family oxidoreductase [Alphaproteobacteria bacterium]
MIGVGLIGLGIMGHRMLAALREHGGFQVVAGFDPAAGEVPGVARVPDVDALLALPEVELVYIASPPAAHGAQLLAGLAAGKAVFCEKPLTADPVEAQQLAEATGQARAAVNFPFATAEVTQRLAALVASGALGADLSAHLRLRFAAWPRPWQAGASAWLAAPQEGGFLREVGSHFLFLAHRLFGPGRVLSATVVRDAQGMEVQVEATLRFGETSLTVDAAIGGSLADDNRFDVVGSAGAAGIADWYRFVRDGVVEDRRPALTSQVAALVDLVDGTKPHPLARVEEAAAVAALVETILAH